MALCLFVCLLIFAFRLLFYSNVLLFFFFFLLSESHSQARFIVSYVPSAAFNSCYSTLVLLADLSLFVA